MDEADTQKKICLASDNCSPAHPLVIQAIVDANEGFAASYGPDRWTEKAIDLIRTSMGAPCRVFMVPTGTGGNVLGLLLACHRYESVVCTDIAHIHYQESGSAEAIVGCKLLTVPHEMGKIRPDHVIQKLRSERAFGKHSTSPRVLAITQPTEIGTVYTLSELKSLGKLCHDENLLLHMDGSRLYNAAVALKAELHDIVLAARIDTLALGGTKNGLVGAEALVVFNDTLILGSEHLHKQTLQLLSKMRYLSAQYIPFLTKKLWSTLAQAANLRAQEIASVISKIPEVSLSYPVETNQVFFTVPFEWILPIQEKISCMLWDGAINQLRFVASWNTSAEDVKGVEAIFAVLAKNL